MSDSLENKGVHEARAAYTEPQSDVVHIQLDIPRDVWNQLRLWAAEHQIKEREAVIQLVSRQVTPPEDADVSGFYADLVGRHLRGELEPGPRLLDIRVNEDIAEAICQELREEYGTDDPVEIIESMRSRQ